ncbi:MAG: ABC transporter ATP-binding protein [Tabrizicola sp.]|jgi:ABC-type Fe3+/spermidine/putrescine transport system ATPase subunit|nr:ABC transporter ATP-binding protein [Tabrizicola sp.]
MTEVRVEGLTKAYGPAKALDEVTLTFPDGGFFGLLGPSGSGKTTLLRAIAGFVTPDTGRIWLGDQAVERVPVEDREIGMVFQSYALFPNMTVAENVAFGLEVRRIPGPDRTRRVVEALDLVQLGGYGGRKPSELSGGQRQRVAMARAIVTRPRVLLLDEPLSALDRALRVDMQIELKRIQREVGITTIFVTHDQEEALTLSDRIGILRDGRLVREGTPRAVYDDPQDAFTARFLGEANVLTGLPEAGGLRLADGTLLPGVTTPAIALRPEALAFAVPPPDTPHRLQARLAQRIFSGATGTLVLDWQGQRLKLTASERDLLDLPAEGSPLWLHWPAAAALALRDAG